MSWVADLRARRETAAERREFMRQLRVTQLEKSVGVELTHPELDLPRITVYRNPNDFEWSRWNAVGFNGVGCYASTKDECVALARERLWQIALARREEPTEVAL